MFGNWQELFKKHCALGKSAESRAPNCEKKSKCQNITTKYYHLPGTPWVKWWSNIVDLNSLCGMESKTVLWYVNSQTNVNNW